MAFIMKPEAQLVFFNYLYNKIDDTVLNRVKKLINTGVAFDVGLYTIKATYQGKLYHHNLTTGSSSIIKGTVPPEVIAAERISVSKFIDTLCDLVSYETHNETPTSDIKFGVEKEEKYSLYFAGILDPFYKIPIIKLLREWLHLDLKQAKDFIDVATPTNPVLLFQNLSESEIQQKGQKLESLGGKSLVMATGKQELPSGFWQMLVNEVIPLRYAQVIGQRVKGTSDSSVYHCVAVNPRVKIASRIFSSGNVSIRAEWVNPTPQELEKLESSGLNMNKNYASMHLNAAGIPFGRVIGGFIVGTGIEFDQMVTSGEKLVVENK